MQLEQKRSDVLFRVLGLFLFVTALVKAWYLATDLFVDVHADMPRSLIWIATAFEVFIAIVLWSRVSSNLKALFASACFSVFLLASGLRWFAGHTSCGCLGSFELPAWASPVVSCICLLLVLFTNRITRETVASSALEVRHGFATLSASQLGYLVGLLAFVVSASVLLSDAAFVYLAGEGDFKPADSIVHLNYGQNNLVSTSFLNRSLYTGELVGIKTSCTCVVASEIVNTKIEPGESYSTVINVRPKRKGPFRERIVYILDHPRQQRIAVDIVGEAF